MRFFLILYLLIQSLASPAPKSADTNLKHLLHTTGTFFQTISAATTHPECYDSFNLLGQSTLIHGFSLTTDSVLTPSKTSCILSMIPVDPDYACCLTIGNFSELTDPVGIYCYDAKGTFLSRQPLNTNPLYFTLSKDTAYLSIILPENLAQSAILIQDGRHHCFVVSKTATTSHASIKKALADIDEEGVILLLPGTYRENVKAWGKKLHLIGTHREECILESSSNSYYAPPLEIAAGTVANLTIRSRGGYNDTKPGAYGIHVEDDGLCNETLFIRNCTISSVSNSAIGIGMRGGCSIVLDQCHLTGREYGLFCHDSAHTKTTGIQNISILHCTLEGRVKNKALRFDSQGVPGATVNVLFSNTTLINQNSHTELITTINQGGRGSFENWRGLKNYYLSPESSGNSEASLNYNTRETSSTMRDFP